MMRKTVPFLLLLALSLPGSADKSQDAYQAGLKAARGGDFKAGITQFEKAVQLDPRNFLALFDLSGAYESLNQPDKALPWALKTVAVKPEFAEAECELGTLYLLHKKDFDRAMTHYRAALLARHPYVDPRFPLPQTRGQALLNVAVIYGETKQFGVAAGAARSLEAHPQATRSQNIATLRKRCEAELARLSTRRFASELQAIEGLKPGPAIVAYEEFLKKHQADPGTSLDQWQLFDGLGLAYAMSGKLDKAGPNFDKAAQCGRGLDYGKWQESTFNLACTLAAQGKPQPALKLLDTVLWVDYITRFDPKGKKVRYLEKIPKDDSLKSLRDSKELKELLTRYAP